ncbi:MAG: IS200/IS605 family transposase [Chitinophagaceae bacterium]|jgi:REP element-mobilizing transposase RayT
MGNTFTQLYIQFVFAVKYRAAQIDDTWRSQLHQFITGLIQSKGHRLIRINSMPDHIHIFVGFQPADSPASLMKAVKSESSKWINDQKFTAQKFQWQEGYGAFSYSKSAVPAVSRYIENQQSHHKHRSFLEEYRLILDRFEVNYEGKYPFRAMI